MPQSGENVTITLNGNVSLTAQLELESGQNVTIDGGEDGATIYVPVTSSGGSALHVPNGAKDVTLTVKNVSFVPGNGTNMANGEPTTGFGILVGESTDNVNVSVEKCSFEDLWCGVYFGHVDPGSDGGVSITESSYDNVKYGYSIDEATNGSAVDVVNTEFKGNTGVATESEPFGNIVVDNDGSKVAYTTLAEALSKAPDGATITLNEDVSSATAINVPANVTIEGNGHTISCTAQIASGAFITIGNESNLRNLIVNAGTNAKHGVQFYCVQGGGLYDVTVEGGYYTSVIVNGAKGVTLENCSLEPTSNAYAHIEYAMGGGVATIPTMTVDGISFEGQENIPQVWIDEATVTRIKNVLDPGATNDQVLAQVKESITNKGYSDLKIMIQLGEDNIESAVADGVTPPAPAPSTPATSDVTVAAAENGKVSVDPASAAEGDEVTVTVTPDEGYELASVSVKDAEGSEVEVTANEDGTYSFEMPAGGATVAASFRASLPFSDADGWYRGAVAYVYSRGLMTGYEGTDLFGPEDALGREQAAMVLYRALGAGAQAPACGLADVEPGAWYAGAVDWAAGSGLIAGYGDGSGLFGVGDALTRDQFAQIIARVAGADLSKADPSALGGFSDGGEVAGWAVPAVSWAVEAGVLEGSDDGQGGTELRSGAEISRGEMATMIMRAAEAGLLPAA